MIIRRLKPEQQKQATWILFISAQIAFIVAMILDRLTFTWFTSLLPANTLDFISGILTGYAMIGMLVFLASTGKLMRSSKKG
jgi:hypothetical protein